MKVFVPILISTLLLIGFTSAVPDENEVDDNNPSTEEYIQKVSKERTVDGTAEQREKVRKLIFSNYDKVNIPDNSSPTFGANLIHIDIDEKRRTVESDLWLKIFWKDSRLKWDKEEMGLSHLRVSPSEVWKPDLTLYNSRLNGGAIEECKDTNLILYSSGTVLWVPPCHVSANCDLTFTRGNELAPTQNCYFQFGSWTYDGIIMELDFANKTNTEMDLSVQAKSEWRITKNIAELNKKYYSCCKEPYTSIYYNFTLTREIEDNNCRI